MTLSDIQRSFQLLNNSPGPISREKI